MSHISGLIMCAYIFFVCDGEQLDEHTRSLRDVISVSREILRCADAMKRRKRKRKEAAAAVATPSNSKEDCDCDDTLLSHSLVPPTPADLYREELEYPAIREAVIAQEQVLLRVTGFLTDIDIPHKYLLNMAR